MDVRIYPSIASGKIIIPPSKSISHRALIAAALSCGQSTLKNILMCDDIKATINGLESLGATFDIKDDVIKVVGIDNFNQLKSTNINCLESGSSLRFLIPIYSLTNQTIIFTGQNRLLERPQSIYQDIFNKQGLIYETNKDHIKIKGAIKPDTFHINGEISSQFISGLLFILPLLNEDSYIIIDNNFESKSYVDLTIDTLKAFNIKIEYVSNNKLYIKANQTYKPCNYEIEADYSQAAFYAVLASINNDLTLLNVKDKSIQGDYEIFNIINSFNIKTIFNKDKISIKKSDYQVHDIDLNNIPDLGPILCVLIAYSKQKATLYNALRLRYKESDRIQSMESELSKLNIDIKSSDDSITIYNKCNSINNNVLSSHKDHRILMSLCILATTLNHEVVIKDIECINKSYPNFFKDLESINIKLEIISS